MGLFSRITNLVTGGVRASLRGGGGGTGVVVTDLAPDDHHRLDRHRQVVLRAAQALYGTTAWTRTAVDIDVLQRMLDEEAFPAGATFELQGVAVVFGDVLEETLGLRWAVRMGEDTLEPVLRHPQDGAIVDVLAIVVESAGRVTLADLIEEVRAPRR